MYLVSEGQLESVWQLSEVLSPPLNNLSLQSSIKFSIADTSKEVGYSAMGLKIPDNIAYNGHRNIKVSGDGLVALRFPMLGYNLVSDLLWFPFFSLCSLRYT